MLLVTFNVLLCGTRRHPVKVVTFVIFKFVQFWWQRGVTFIPAVCLCFSPSLSVCLAIYLCPFLSFVLLPSSLRNGSLDSSAYSWFPLAKKDPKYSRLVQYFFQNFKLAQNALGQWAYGWNLKIELMDEFLCFPGW